MKAKKVLSLFIMGALIGALTACGSQAAATEEAADEAEEAVEEAAEEEAVETLDADAGSDEEAAEEETAEDVPTESKELIVFAAASMTETLEEIEKIYEAANPGIDIIYNLDSSGTLKTQIEEGADCDIFISAAQKQMNQLDIESDEENNPDRLDYVASETRINLLENKVALVVAPGSTKGIDSFDALAQHLKDGDILMSMGNEDVPVGQYTQKILAYYELSEEELANAGVLTYGTNVKDVTTQVSQSSVDCGVVYATDAFSAGLDIIDTATAEMCGQVIYPAAVLKVSKNPAEAQAFLDYLTTDEAMAVFEAVGFSPVE